MTYRFESMGPAAGLGVGSEAEKNFLKFEFEQLDRWWY